MQLQARLTEMVEKEELPQNGCRAISRLLQLLSPTSNYLMNFSLNGQGNWVSFAFFFPPGHLSISNSV